jgi:hypothetical protein
VRPCGLTGNVVVVLAFKTVYTLEQKRRDNDRKIISLYVGMKDMMGALLLYVFPSIPGCPLTSRSLKDVENDKLIAPDGTNIKDRLKSLVECTADDIKTCSNVCDAYMKKRLLAKVLLSTLWDARLLDFVKLFATRRRDFEFELTMHSSQGIDKANVKLDSIGNATRELNEQFGYLCLPSVYVLILLWQNECYEGAVRAISQPRAEAALGSRKCEWWRKGSPEQ